MFIKYSTGQTPPKKSRGKGSQGKKTADTLVADVYVFKEFDSEPTRKRIASRRVIKKKVIISAADNIITDPDVTLELGKSISLTKAAEEEASRQVHTTHARNMTESVPEPARRRPLGISFRDTSRVSKKVSSDPSQKLKGVQSLTPKEQEVADTMQALKESKKTSKKIASEGTGTKPRVPDEEKVTSEENVILEWCSEQESEYLEKDQRDDEEVDWIYSDEDDEKKDDADDDKINDEEDDEMSNAEVEDSRKGDAEISDMAKANAEKIEEIKDDAKKAELPSMSSNLSVSLSFGDQFLKISSDTSLVTTVKDTTNVEIKALLDIKIQSEVPHIQSPFILNVHVLVISEPSVLTLILKTPLVAPTTTLLTRLYQKIAPIPTPLITTDAPTITTAICESDALSTVQLRVAKLEKDVSELKKIDHSAEALSTLKSQVLTVIEHYLGSKIRDDLQKVLQRHTADLIQKYFVKPAPESSKIQKPTIDLEQEYEKRALEIHKIKREQAKKQKMPKYTIKSTDKVTLKEYDQKSALYQTIHENKSFNRILANHTFYHALMEALIEDENAMDKGVAYT
ncbi:hypothetical protein Tco_0976112 [Tanacetum coccineum]|uniref:Uncharacterized protein n=1 Tax=Tanacetum coccineum TaxID=301880 RepID=A0ABQ5EGE9_9ASTR